MITTIYERAALAVEMMELSAAGFGSVRLTQLFNRRAASGDPRYAPWRGLDGGRDQKPDVEPCPDRRAPVARNPHAAGRGPQPEQQAQESLGHPNPGRRTDPEYFPAIVGRGPWNRVEAAKAQRARVKNGRPSRDNVNLFSGLCHCGACGSAMHLRGSNHRGKNDHVVCSGHIRHTCDNSIYYSVTRLERAFLRDGLSKVAAAWDFAKGDEHADALATRLDHAKLARNRGSFPGEAVALRVLA